MSVKTLSEIEASIEQLDLQDQVRLLQYLTPKIAAAVLAPSSEIDEPWHRFRALGDRLAATSIPGAASITESLSEMRR